MAKTINVRIPAIELDLETASTRAFDEALAKFYGWSETQPPIQPLSIQSGWHSVDWQQAEDYLRRNICNRKAGLSHVKRLHYDMANGDWHRTGQGLVFNEAGELNEGQHRLWACYFGKVSFETYIVTDAPKEVDLFAYYDDVKPRSAADALQTSGANGIAGSLATAVHLCDRYDRDLLGILRQPKAHKLTSREVLAFSRDHLSLAETGHMVLSTYGKAVNVIQHKGVAIFFSDRVLGLYGQTLLDEFMTRLGSGANLDEDDPVLGLRNRLMSEDKINKERILALLIKAFNLYRAGKKLSNRGLFVRDNEKFPKLETVTESAGE
jgi:hypothetical protein